jgi:creatinine amidohydrolase/Fe(II)-dependent formamide hydrolase-like protein
VCRTGTVLGGVMLLLLAPIVRPPEAGPPSRSVLIEELTWTEVRDAIAEGKTTAIYYAGSTEQNGPHMVLGKHNFVARDVGRRIAEELGNALVYPVMPFAVTGDPARKTGHMRFPGSVHVSDETFGAVARDVAVSAIAAGFRHVVLMGDHGDGQTALKRVAADLDARWGAKGVHVHYAPDVYFKAQAQAREFLAGRQLVAGRHAGLADTSELMSIDRDGVWVRKDRLAMAGEGRGVDGDPRQASAELGHALVELKVRNAVVQIRRLTAPAR